MDYKKQGFSIVDLFLESEIKNLENTLLDLLKMQAKKIRINVSENDNLDSLCSKIQNIYPKALDEVFGMFRNSSVGHKLASNNLLQEYSMKFLETTNPVIISGPSFFINIKSNKTRKYTWHSEQNWYPKRRNFLNVWCPIIYNRPENESMAMLIGSQNKDWFYFSEYTGYDGNFDPSANVQYEIPDNFIKDYTEVIPKVDKGQAIFFDGRLVHRSVNTQFEHPVYTIVFRAFDYTNDLTLSSNWADIPYNRQSLGFPNINID